MPSFKIAQMVLVRWTKGLSELQLRNNFKRHLLNHWSKFHITSHECSPWCPFQNCTNDSAPPNMSAARAPDKKSFKWHLLNHWSKFKIISQNCSTKFAQMVPLCWTQGPLELQHRNIFKQHILLNHWSKSHITSHGCSPWCPLSKLPKSTEQRGC